MVINKFCGRGRNTHGGGQGRKTYSTGNRLTCQLCNKYGHSVIECWHMYDENFEPTHYNTQSQGSVGNTSNASQWSKAQEPPTPNANGYLAYHNSLPIPRDLESHVWFLYSCASHHIRSSIRNLQFLDMA